MAKQSKVYVALDDGALALCTIVERMGYNPDIAANTIWVENNGKEFMAVRKLGAWRKWGAADRARPLIEHL
jgi:hypothetical protein